MAKTKTKQPAQEVVELEEIEIEAEEQGVRPNDLAKELNVDGKRIRAFLRQNFSRDNEAKNTSWYLTDEQVEAVRAKFSESDDDES